VQRASSLRRLFISQKPETTDGFNDIAIMPLYDRHYGIQALSDFMVGNRISKRFIEPDALADISEHN
jgi:hypothetical protein